jgi:hypothetical protein
MMPEKRSQWKYDPSRAMTLGVDDTSFDGRDDPPVLPGCSDSGGWRNGAGQDPLAFGRRGCNNVGRGNSGNRERTPHGIAWPGKLDAREPLRHVSPPALAGGGWTTTTASWHFRTASMSSLTKVAISGTLSLPTAGSLLTALETKIISYGVPPGEATPIFQRRCILHLNMG